MTDQADIAKLLLEHKANVDYQDKAVISTLLAYNMTEALLLIVWLSLIGGSISSTSGKSIWQHSNCFGGVRIWSSS